MLPQPSDPEEETLILQEPGGNPIITKDGVTVAQVCEPFEDPFEKMQLPLLIKAGGSSETNSMAGRWHDHGDSVSREILTRVANAISLWRLSCWN